MNAKRKPRMSRSAALVAAFVLALSGLLFTVSAQLAKTSGTSRHPESVVALVSQRTAHVATVSAQISALDQQIQELSGTDIGTIGGGKAGLAARTAAGTKELRGPGLKVTLKDSPLTEVPAGAVADDLVIHQQDLQAVVNALWAGGAEAMSLQGKRITAQSAIRCVGNVLYLQGEIYSPPYTIEAIGEASALHAALDSDRSIQIYQQYVEAYSLGWKVSDEKTITIPATTDTQRLRYAEPLTQLEATATASSNGAGKN
ncbi:DUF881 domain-containing protein [Rarobacter incanus]|uniref:Uncharacterized protein YlxW (UPF0749 family) n=1 Tax=Rarobacter incanus TaxID=153494 RepID=A0A542SPU4_9MICO|nr:DUF881 domain-containing protein [Rarobacter incanus]TQK76643.1 uncharacterized protein YlxW (UPF0749 family) [Rarobacter incanus]